MRSRWPSSQGGRGTEPSEACGQRLQPRQPSRNRNDPWMAERAVYERAPNRAAAMAVGGVVALEAGAAVAHTVFATAGVAGTVALRLGFGSVLLAIRRRPALPLSRLQLAAVGGVGLLLAVHHLAFYEAVDRLPLGVAVTLEFCGPLAVALAGSRRLEHIACAAVAAAGIVLASGFGLTGRWSAVGVGLALLAGACWAAYITLFPRLEPATERARVLSTVTLLAAAMTLPYGLAVDHCGMLTARALGLGLLIATLADLTAYTLQAHALSRLSARAFSVLTSTEPAAWALIGLAALGQRIDVAEWAGVVLVTLAAGVTGWRG